MLQTEFQASKASGSEEDYWISYTYFYVWT